MLSYMCRNETSSSRLFDTFTVPKMINHESIMVYDHIITHSVRKGFKKSALCRIQRRPLMV